MNDDALHFVLARVKEIMFIQFALGQVEEMLHFLPHDGTTYVEITFSTLATMIHSYYLLVVFCTYLEKTSEYDYENALSRSVVFIWFPEVILLIDVAKVF